MAGTTKQQFLALKQRSAQTQTALEKTHTSLQIIEEELAGFLNDYYAKVGAAFERLSELQQELHAVSAQCFELPSYHAAPRGRAETVHKKQDIKQFYHAMARDCHPDHAAGAPADVTALRAELMKTLNAAYARKNLSEMWQIKWKLEQSKHAGVLDHKQRLALLIAQQEQMQSALDELRRRESDIKDSEAYQLMQHARLLELCGQDFVALVKARVTRQIAETKKQLVSARIQQRYWQHVKMAPAAAAAKSA